MVELELKYFEEGWKKQDLPVNCPSEILNGHGIGRYKDVRQITFLTPEAKSDFLNYREWIEKKRGKRLGSEEKFVETLESLRTSKL